MGVGREWKLEMGRGGAGAEGEPGEDAHLLQVGMQTALGWVLQWPVLSLCCCPPATMQTHTEQGQTTELPLGLAFYPLEPQLAATLLENAGEQKNFSEDPRAPEPASLSPTFPAFPVSPGLSRLLPGQARSPSPNLPPLPPCRPPGCAELGNRAYPGCQETERPGLTCAR